MVMRTYGLSGSGMDVDSMVKDLMKARRASYDALVQKKTQAEWRKTDYNTLYNSIKEFRNNTLFQFKRQNNLSPKAATSSNTGVLTAAALGDAADISHSIKVDQLADGVKKGSAAAITAAGRVKDSLATQFDLAEETFALRLTNGTQTKEIAVDTRQSVYELVGSINSSGIGIKASYDATLDRFFLYTSNTGSTASIDFTGSSSKGLDFMRNSLKINTGASFKGSADAITTGTGKNSLMEQFGIGAGTFQFNLTNAGVSATITVDPTKDINQLINDINNAGVNVQAAYNADTDRFTLKTTNGGAWTGIDFTGTTGAGLSFLQNNLRLNTDAMAESGVDAIIDLDGVQNIAKTTNNFTVSSVSYTLKTTGSANVSVDPDIEATVKNVKAFVESYNSLISKINGELNEEVYRSYLPLTDAQREKMSDSQITAWEAKAKSGMLRKESALRDIMLNIRNSMIDKVDGVAGKYTRLSDLGIKTGSYLNSDGDFTTEWKEGGKLYVDEDDLRKALADDPDIVYKLFATDGDNAGGDGAAVRLYDELANSLKKIETRAGFSASAASDTTSYYGKLINDYDKRLATMEDQLKMMEDRYYRQFDAMENAISRMNQQSAWLSQQFASGSSS